MAGGKSGFCTECGNRIIGSPHKLNGKAYCGDCYIKVAQAAKTQDAAVSEVYSYIQGLFGVQDIPFSLQSAITRQIEEGHSPSGVRFTIYYYYEVLGNEPNDITKVSWVIRDMYEEARSYVEEMRKLGEINKDVPIHEPVTIEVSRPESKRRILKRWNTEG